MKKSEEVAASDSYWNKAKDDELVFVILERDPVAVSTVLAWVNARVEGGHNVMNDAKIQTALHWCNAVASKREG